MLLGLPKSFPMPSMDSDLMVETSMGQEIEMQTSLHSNLKKRMLYYASKAFTK
ncbi:hypothetical protein [Sphingobacterium alkalisoli]|uniref:hypothetical protein n=1 Tax=Sphingobacterium alkalisoli TaxID=1874115 RepID=UPI00145D117D|nr:hypothetical protein [Sphingobacterium alkalisoli]